MTNEWCSIEKWATGGCSLSDRKHIFPDFDPPVNVSSSIPSATTVKFRFRLLVHYISLGVLFQWLRQQHPRSIPPFPSPFASVRFSPAPRHYFFIRLLEKRRGVNFSLVAVLSPWLGIYVPIPLGILNGSWSLHCAKRGHIRHHSTGSCASRGGLCGTDWGCSGPSCAVNLGES